MVSTAQKRKSLGLDAFSNLHALCHKVGERLAGLMISQALSAEFTAAIHVEDGSVYGPEWPSSGTGFNCFQVNHDVG